MGVNGDESDLMENGPYLSTREGLFEINDQTFILFREIERYHCLPDFMMKTEQKL